MSYQKAQSNGCIRMQRIYPWYGHRFIYVHLHISASDIRRMCKLSTYYLDVQAISASDILGCSSYIYLKDASVIFAIPWCRSHIFWMFIDHRITSQSIPPIHRFFDEMKGGSVIEFWNFFLHISIYTRFYCKLNKIVYIFDFFSINNTVGSYFYSNSSLQLSFTDNIAI